HTSHPSRARLLAAASPMPALPPVTSATLPEIPRSMSGAYCRNGTHHGGRTLVSLSGLSTPYIARTRPSCTSSASSCALSPSRLHSIGCPFAELIPPTSYG